MPTNFAPLGTIPGVTNPLLVAAKKKRKSPLAKPLTGSPAPSRQMTPLGPLGPVAQPPVQEAPSIAPMIQDPVAFQRRLGPGRYTRPTPGLAGLANPMSPPQTPQEQLGQAMAAATPSATEPVASTILRQGQIGSNLGRYTPAFAGTIPEYATAMRNFRDQVAAGGNPQYPGSFRTTFGDETSPTPGVPTPRAAAEQQLGVATERRQARRDAFAGAFVPKEIRQRLVTAKRQGRQISPVIAAIEHKLDKNQALTPAEMLAYHGELGQKELESQRMAETATKEQELTARTLLSQAALGALANPNVDSQAVLDILQNPAFQSAVGGLPPGLDGTKPKTTATTPATPNLELILRQAPIKVRDAIQAAILNNDPSAVDNALKGLGKTREERDAIGISTFGEEEWKYRESPVSPTNLRTIFQAYFGSIFPGSTMAASALTGGTAPDLLNAKTTTTTPKKRGRRSIAGSIKQAGSLAQLARAIQSIR